MARTPNPDKTSLAGLVTRTVDERTFDVKILPADSDTCKHIIVTVFGNAQTARRDALKKAKAEGKIIDISETGCVQKLRAMTLEDFISQSYIIENTKGDGENGEDH